MHTHTHAHISHAHTHTHTHAHTTHARTHTTHARTHTHNTCTHTHTQHSMHMHTHTYAHTHVHTQTQTHTHREILIHYFFKPYYKRLLLPITQASNRHLWVRAYICSATSPKETLIIETLNGLPQRPYAAALCSWSIPWNPLIVKQCDYVAAKTTMYCAMGIPPALKPWCGITNYCLQLASPNWNGIRSLLLPARWMQVSVDKLHVCAIHWGWFSFREQDNSKSKVADSERGQNKLTYFRGLR